MSEEKKEIKHPDDYTDYMKLLENRILVRPAKAEEITAGGIIIPESVKKRADQGVIVAAGPGPSLKVDGSFGPMTLQLGDSILFAKMAGIELMAGEERLLMMRETDVFCTLNNKDTKVEVL